ncbi:hypothetical protein NC652_017637 [Populus alba x Populus x berolinensis]|nr:hypothetical protein NC652_017637 [Populus alba x Populus x berolinensis]
MFREPTVAHDSALGSNAPDPAKQNQHFSSIFAMQRLDESNHTINLISGKDVSAFPLISKSPGRRPTV